MSRRVLNQIFPGSWPRLILYRQQRGALTEEFKQARLKHRLWEARICIFLVLTVKDGRQKRVRFTRNSFYISSVFC